jgi:acyl transferase domain-containing protein
MIVMAVEAARQVADEDKPIKGYELRDIKISKAIMIPQDEEGSETTIQMRPWKLGSRAATSTWTWQEFVICSKGNGQDWEENCSGLIQIQYEQQPQTSNENFEEQSQIEEHHQRYLEVKKACTFNEIPRQVYESLETIGMQYGPIFQNLTRLQSGDHTSTGVIRIPDTRSVMPQRFEFPHIIHPATLDTIFQLSLPALTGMKEPLKFPMVPTFVESLFISSSIKTAPGDELNGYACAKDSGYRLKDSQIVIWDTEVTRPQVIVRGLRSMALSAMTTGNVLSDSLSNVRKLCLQPIWKEDIDLMTREQATASFRKPADAVQHVDPVIIEELELAAFVYVQRALKTFSSDQASGFTPHLNKLYGWMQHQQDLALKGGLERQNWQFDWLNIDSEYEKQLLLRVAEQTVEGKLLCHLGEHLESMFSGKVEPLQLMLEDDLLYDFYRYGIGSLEMNGQMAEYIDRIAHKQPDISILEIGGGTGGSTLPILQKLGGHQGTSPRFSSYTFTDISVEFFEKATDKLKEWGSYLTFQKLNIEEDPEIQGFELGTYDVIIAVNVSIRLPAENLRWVIRMTSHTLTQVLHATHSIDKTLANVKNLLKPYV